MEAKGKTKLDEEEIPVASSTTLELKIKHSSMEIGNSRYILQSYKNVVIKSVKCSTEI